MKYVYLLGSALTLVYLAVFGSPDLWVTMHATFLYWPVVAVSALGLVTGVVSIAKSVRAARSS